MSRLFVTGDTHGDYDIAKLNTHNFSTQEELSKDEYFTINRARQYGKTTTLSRLDDQLKDKYTVLRLSFEGVAEKELLKSRNTLFDDLIKKCGKQC